MGASIYDPTSKEIRLAEELRALAVAEIEKSADVNKIASELDLAPSGLRTLVRDSSWDLTTAVRVADILGIEFEFNL